MATDPGKAGCPVCTEPLDRGAGRCFRCESDLAAWWPFEEKLGSLPNPRLASTIETRRPVQSHPLVWIAAVLAAGVAGLSLGLGLNQASRGVAIKGPPTESTAAAPALLAPTAPPVAGRPEERAIKIVVQKGDSLWRLAKTLTGRGESWGDLWPNTSPVQARSLVEGTELTVVLPQHPIVPSTRH